MSSQNHINEYTEDNVLFQSIQEGDRRAFTVAYEKYNKMLYVLAFRYLKDQYLAEDTVQQVFTKLWEFHSDITISISLKNYLYTMTKNYILNQIRNANSAIVKNYEIAQSSEMYVDNLFAKIEEKELMSIFYQAIEMLPEQKKAICLLKMEEQISNQKIAEKMNISINTVKTHYAQAIKMLRTHIEKMLIVIISFILS